eukprot:114605_1
MTKTSPLSSTTPQSVLSHNAPENTVTIPYSTYELPSSQSSFFFFCVELRVAQSHPIDISRLGGEGEPGNISPLPLNIPTCCRADGERQLLTAPPNILCSRF